MSECPDSWLVYFGPLTHIHRGPSQPKRWHLKIHFINGILTSVLHDTDAVLCPVAQIKLTKWVINATCREKSRNHAHMTGNCAGPPNWWLKSSLCCVVGFVNICCGLCFFCYMMSLRDAKRSCCLCSLFICVFLWVCMRGSVTAARWHYTIYV